jgi:hypothetical protein
MLCPQNTSRLSYVCLAFAARRSSDPFAARAVDRYVEARTGAGNKDERLDAIMETIFSRCMEEGNLKQVCSLVPKWRQLNFVLGHWCCTRV